MWNGINFENPPDLHRILSEIVEHLNSDRNVINLVSQSIAKSSNKYTFSNTYVSEF